VLKRAKNWRELVALEFNGKNLEKLANKYNLTNRTVFTFLQEINIIKKRRFCRHSKEKCE